LSQKYVDPPTDLDAAGLKIVIKCCTSIEPKNTPTETAIASKSNLISENSVANIAPTCTPIIETPRVRGKIIPKIRIGKKRTRSAGTNSPLQPALATEKPKIRLRIVPIQ
jgi:hypothetical protein